MKSTAQAFVSPRGRRHAQAPERKAAHSGPSLHAKQAHKIERDVIARGIFTSVPDLRRKLMRYIRQYNQSPKPVKWTHRNPLHRITTDSSVTVH